MAETVSYGLIVVEMLLSTAMLSAVCTCRAFSARALVRSWSGKSDDGQIPKQRTAFQMAITQRYYGQYWTPRISQCAKGLTKKGGSSEKGS